MNEASVRVVCGNNALNVLGASAPARFEIFARPIHGANWRPGTLRQGRGFSDVGARLRRQRLGSARVRRRVAFGVAPKTSFNQISLRDSLSMAGDEDSGGTPESTLWTHLLANPISKFGHSRGGRAHLETTAWSQFS